MAESRHDDAKRQATVEVSLTRLQAILDNAVDAIITIDEHGIIESVNPATAILFDYPVQEIIGNNVNMLMPSPYDTEHDGYIANYLATGERKIIGIGREVLGRRKDGTTFPTHLAVSEIKVGNRRLFTGIVRDISDLKEAEERLARMNAELEQRVRERTAQLSDAQSELVKKEKLATLGQVAGGIAHEIRNPLNAVKTSAYYLLHAQNPSAEKRAEHLHRIDRQVALIDNVITALLDVAKLTEPSFHPLAIGECIDSVLLATTLPENIDVTFEIQDDLPAVLADKNQIPIVFRNLILNARDAMADGGTLAITANLAGGRVRVEIRDTGVGIPAEDLGRIMEPLFSTKSRGIGLGLAISHAVLKKNNGDLSVTSEPGTGSTFTVDLQAAED